MHEVGAQEGMDWHWGFYASAAPLRCSLHVGRTLNTLAAFIVLFYRRRTLVAAATQHDQIPLKLRVCALPDHARCRCNACFMHSACCLITSIDGCQARPAYPTQGLPSQDIEPGGERACLVMWFCMLWHMHLENADFPWCVVRQAA